MAEDADLFAELAADQGHWNGIACKWRAWLDTQAGAKPSPEEWQAAIAAKERFTISSIEAALKRRGADIGRSTLARHRNDQCKQCRT